MYFQDACSVQAYRLLVVYEHTMAVAVTVMVTVVWFLFSRLRGGKAGVYCNKYLEHKELELGWSLYPLVLLLPVFVLSS